MLEKLIDIAAGLKEQLREIEHLYRRLPAVLKQEEDAIAAGAINEVAQTAEKKQDLGDSIEVHFNKINDYRRQLSNVLGKQLDGPQTLSDCMTILMDLANSSEGTQLQKDVLTHTSAGLMRAFGDFNEVMIEVKPLIERNRYLVTNLANNYSESMKFWQEIIRERESSYNSKGRQQQTGPGSTLHIKA